MNIENLSEWIKDDHGHYKKYDNGNFNTIFVGTIYSDIYLNYTYYFFDPNIEEIFPPDFYLSDDAARKAADLAIEKYFKLRAFI